MPVTQAAIAINPFKIMASAEAPPAAAHRIYTLAECRVASLCTPDPMAPLIQRVSGNRNVAGDAYYLHFFNDKITSVRLPFPAPAGVNFFYTDNMSGCKFYVDTVGGANNDIVVYHANTTLHGPLAADHADTQKPLAVNALDTLHNNAMADHAPLVLANVASLGKGRYFQSAGNRERHKIAQGRTAVSFTGGCTIVGFPGAARWEFFFQAWGDVAYSRTSSIAGALFTGHWQYVHNRRVQGKHHNIAYANMRVMESGQIW